MSKTEYQTNLKVLEQEIVSLSEEVKLKSLAISSNKEKIDSLSQQIMLKEQEILLLRTVNTKNMSKTVKAKK